MSPDPDGAGILKHRAVRLTWRPDGQVSKQELGTVNSQSDGDWANFAVAQTVDIAFDTNSRPNKQTLSSGGTTYALTHQSYDALGRADCTALRMDPAQWNGQSANCTPQTNGPNGPDRISQTVYDAAGQVTQLKVAVGTADAATERTLTWTNNGQLATLKDAEANLTTFEYDGHDRLAKTRFPVTAKGANSSSTSDYEQLSYDANGNVTSRRLRDGNSIAFAFDNLNRVILKNLPGSEPDVTFAYDNLGRMTSASQTGHALSFTYDALSRVLTQGSPNGTVSSQWDVAGRKTRVTHPDGFFVDYDYLVTGELAKARENGASSGIGVLAAMGYDDLGRRTSLTFGNGVSQAFGYDAVSRLTSLTHNESGTSYDNTITLTYNPASQIATRTVSNDVFAWTGHSNESTSGTANGLNQLTAVGGVNATHDAKGNVTTDPATGNSYAYSSENLLTSGTVGGVTTNLGYDPLMRLHQLPEPPYTTQFLYDGLDLVTEYYAPGQLVGRHVFDPDTGQPLITYLSGGTGSRVFLTSDERGSVLANTHNNGTLLYGNSYDEFGRGAAWNRYRFQYTGQAWIPEAGAYYYKARFYSPKLGRFLQPDPIGAFDSPNPYQYVLNDPVNRVDPLGLQEEQAIVITGTMPPVSSISAAGAGPGGFASRPGAVGRPRAGPFSEPVAPAGALPAGEEIVVTGTRLSRAVTPSAVQLAVRLLSREEPIVITGQRPIKVIGARVRLAAGERPTKQDFCGSKGSEGIPDQIGEIDLGNACAAHDRCYGTKGADKAGCDVRLGGDVFMACMEATVLVPLCIVTGTTYFGGVFFGGWPAYLDAQRVRKESQ